MTLVRTPHDETVVDYACLASMKAKKSSIQVSAEDSLAACHYVNDGKMAGYEKFKHVLKSHNVPVKFASKDTIRHLEKTPSLENYVITTPKLFIKTRKFDHSMSIATYDTCGCVAIGDFKKFIAEFSQKHQTTQFLVGFDKGGEKSGSSTKLTIHPLLSQSPADCQVIGLFYACDEYCNVAAVFSSVFGEISRLDGKVLEGHCTPLQFFLDSDRPGQIIGRGPLWNGPSKILLHTLLRTSAWTCV